MTNTTQAAVRAKTAQPMLDQITQIWTEMVTWISSHGLQIIVGTAVATAIVLLLLGVKTLGLRLCRSDVDHSHWRTVIGKALSRTRFWFMIAVAAQLVAGYANAPDFVAQTIRFIFTVAVALQIAIWARTIIVGVIEHRAGVDADGSSIGSAIGIIRLLISVAIFVIAAIVILDNLGVNVTGLVAGLGIGGIAIGLAAQGIFADLFAALSILFDKPFRRGDAIRWDTTSGSVERIGLKSTRIRAVTGEEVVISNTNLLNKELHNMARLDRRRHVLTLGIVYQTPHETRAAIPDMLRAIVEAQDKGHFVRCGVTGFGASSLDYELQFDVQSSDYEEVFDARHRVLLAILKAFDEAGIGLAYPTQTSFTAAPDGTLIMPYAEETRLVHESEDENVVQKS